MWKIISKVLAPPTFRDDEKTRVARLLNVVLLTTTVGLFFLSVGRILSGGTFNYTIVILGMLLGLMIIAQVLMRRGYVHSTALIVISIALAGLTALNIINDGVRDTAYVGYLIVIMLAIFLLGNRAGILFAGLSIAIGWGMVYLEYDGIIAGAPDVPESVALDLTAIFGISTGILILVSGSLRDTVARARQSEAFLAERNQELEDIQDSLEDRVLDRTRKFEIVARLGEQLNAVLDFNQLLDMLVEEVTERLGYYHAHIYLLDDQQRLTIAAATGDVGVEMKARGEQVRSDVHRSPAVRAARTGQIVRVDDMQASYDWWLNSKLPDARSELAIPILVGDGVAGVLVVIQDRIAGFEDIDVNVLRTLVSQVSVIIRNLRLFLQTNQALTDVQTVQSKYLVQAWEQAESLQQEVIYHRPGVPDMGAETMDHFSQQVWDQERPEVIVGAENQSILVPLKLGQATIGALQLHQVSKTDDTQWSESDLRMIEAVLDQVAQTAENLRLLSVTQERASREQLIGRISDKLRRAPDFETLLKIGVDELAQHLNPSRVFVQMESSLTQATDQKVAANEPESSLSSADTSDPDLPAEKTNGSARSRPQMDAEKPNYE
jgi:GAF domain-containing protein